MAVQGALGGDPGKLRKIIAFREMPQNDVGGLAVILGFEVGCGGLIRKVTYAGEDSLLHRPGVGAVTEHFEVVVGLKQQKINPFELSFYVGRDVAEIGCYR